MLTHLRSFLPQIVGSGPTFPAERPISPVSFLLPADGQLFYATFDPTLGPTVLHQVPENLISSLANDQQHPHSRSVSRSRSRPRSGSGPADRRASPALKPLPLPTLLDFSMMSEYVIPKKPLLGKLVTFRTPGAWDVGDDGLGDGDGDGDAEINGGVGLVVSMGAGVEVLGSPDVGERRGRRLKRDNTASGVLPISGGARRAIPKREYRVLGLPSVLDSEAQYERNQYIWNLCFVFRAHSCVSAFEPVVRKVARILRSAELDSSYLSSPSAAFTPLNAVLEQLFEDLNSYSETSIPLDGYNTLELKLFPFYPNPPEVNDWDVPIALVNLAQLKDSNWDITAARVAQYINGINHAFRIAQLADVDPVLVCEVLRHMLYYQVIMMIDIFQYSNVYAINEAFPRLTADENVISECGAYVTRPGFPVADWPTLAGLYTRLRPSDTVHSWGEKNNIAARGIDPRRFVSFGIIKGFLRRVHRWPIIIDHQITMLRIGYHGPMLVGTVGPPEPTRRRVGFSSGFHSHGRDSRGESTWSRQQAGDSTFTLRSTNSQPSVPASPRLAADHGPHTPPFVSGRSPGRRGTIGPHTGGGQSGGIIHGTLGGGGLGGGGLGSGGPLARNSAGHSLTSASAGDTHPSISSRRTGTLRSGGGTATTAATGITGHMAHGSISVTAQRARDGRAVERADELIALLDGHHHADEIQVHMGMSWEQLEKTLGLDGISHGVGVNGVAVVYR